MSTEKVIFTYRRKRLSSCSGTGLACPDFSSDVRTAKHEDTSEERLEKPIKDIKTFKCPNSDNVDLSMNSNSCIEQHNLQLAESRHELDGDYTSKSLNISAAVSLVKSLNSCFDLNLCCPHLDGCLHGGSVSQAAEKDPNSPQKLSFPGNSEIGKAKWTTPLLTFSRRLKRKVDSGNEDMNRKLVTREGTVDVKDNKPVCVSSCSCEVKSNNSKRGEECVDLIVETGEANMTDVLCHGKGETISKEIGNSPCSFTGSHDAKQAVADTPNFLKENVKCSSSIGVGISHGDDTCKTDKQPVPNQLQRASSADSQLTSTDGSESIVVVGKTAYQKASSSFLNVSGHPPGGFVIDCNVIPESNLEEQESDIFHDSLGMGKNRVGKSLQLFGDSGVEAEGSRLGKFSKDACTPHDGESKQNNKWLQLFPTDRKSCSFPPAEKNSTFCIDSNSRKNWHGQCSSAASAFLGFSSEPPMGQTSKHSFIPREFTQNTMAPPFLDHSSYTLRHRLLFETINAKANPLRGNRNPCSDIFEPCPVVWSEEELDSLWIGVRRHGRGNWHATLLDPRLRFSPWRTASDLAHQWEREQRMLLSAPHMPHGSYSNGMMGESVSAETQLSLGDVYAQKEVTAQSYGITPHNNSHLRMASCGLFNNLLREPLGSFPTLSQMRGSRIVHPFAEPACVPGNPPSGVHPCTRKRVVNDNLIVIDSSDASSEETVSDHRNAKR